MFGWFGKKQPEVSPGGSTIHRYPEAEWQPGRTGEPDESAVEFAQSRRDVYQRFFGERSAISEEPGRLVPRIDVETYYRRSATGATTCAMVTSGMSDLPMKAPAEAVRRTELIFYCTEPKPEYIATLRWLAHFPHDQKTWIGMGHTVPNGNPPAPFWGSSILDTVLFMPTIVSKDATLPEELILAGDPVDFLWVVPLTTAETKLKLKKGFPAILDLFEKNRHPHVYNPNRPSYV